MTDENDRLGGSKRGGAQVALERTGSGARADDSGTPRVASSDSSTVKRPFTPRRSTMPGARAWLATNCASCHQPGGPTPVTLDLRYEVSAAQMNAVLVAPSAGDLGLPDAYLIAPGARASSVLWERMRRLDDTRMPPLASHVVDDFALELVGQWIDAGAP